MERSIGILSGRIAAPAAAALPPSAADALLANQLAARAFGAGDVGHFEALMTLGARANLAENFAAAEQAYRAALAMQQKALGPGRSGYRRAADAPRAAGLRPGPLRRGGHAVRPRRGAGTARRPTASPPARLLHYRALHALNQGQLAAGPGPAAQRRSRLRGAGAARNAGAAAGGSGAGGVAGNADRTGGPISRSDGACRR